VGDGTVVLAQWKGGYGKAVQVRHNGVYSTQYAHLSRFAKGIRKGAKVKQGQVVGYVGATGLATGPHLDFRLIKNGKFMNPLKLSSPRTRSVSADQKEEFGRVTRLFLAEMGGVAPQPASLAHKLVMQ
jgi:murein DD-endopeptidase MepM/ murein hydrolase activator NlpD